MVGVELKAGFAVPVGDWLTKMWKLLVGKLFFNSIRFTNLVSIIRLAVLHFSSARYFDVISPGVYLAMICLSLTLNLVVQISFGIQAAKKRTEWAKNTVDKFANKSWLPTKIGDIRVGDLIKIKEGEFCPVDLLLISTSETKIAHKLVHVNEKTITGSNNMVFKHPIRDFPKDLLNSEERRAELSGVVEYSTPNSETEGIMGIFKIKGDPRVTPIKSSNIIFAGTVVYLNEISGFVLYTGVNTKFSKKTGIMDFSKLKKVLKSESSMTTLIDALAVFFTVLSCYTAFCLLLYYDETSLAAKRSRMIWEVSEFQYSGPRTYFQVVSIISSVLPQFLAILQEMINLIVGIRFQQSHRQTIAAEMKSAESTLLRQNNARFGTEAGQSESPLFSERMLPFSGFVESPLNIRDSNRGGLMMSVNSSHPQSNLKNKLYSGMNLSIASPEPQSRKAGKVSFPITEPFSVSRDTPAAGSAEAPARELKLIDLKHTTSLGREFDKETNLLTAPHKHPEQPSMSSAERPNNANSSKQGKLAGLLKSLEKIFSWKSKPAPKSGSIVLSERPDTEGVTDILERNKDEKSAREARAKKQFASVFDIEASSWSRVLNPSLITNLGNVDHVIFDKTDTLTMSKKQIVFITTLKRTYNLLDENDGGEEDLEPKKGAKFGPDVPLAQRVEEFQKNPVYKGESKSGGHYDDLNTDPQDYDEFYEEKSQEYHKELLVEYDSKLFEEDSQFEEIRAVIKMPDFMPRKNDSSSIAERSVTNKDDLTDNNSKRKADYADPISVASLGITPGNPRSYLGLHHRESSGGNKSGFADDFLIAENLPFARGRKQTLIRGTNISNASYRDFFFPDDATESDEPDEIVEIGDGICQVKSQNAFLYDNYSRTEEIEYMFCACGLFLYCGMTELIAQFTPTHINNALAEFLEAMKVRVWSTDRHSGSASGQSPGLSGSAGQSQDFMRAAAGADGLNGYKVTISSEFGMMRHFKVLGYNPRTDGRQITSIVVALTGSNKDQYYLLARGDEQQMRSLMDLSPHEQTIFRNLMIQYKELLLSRTVFAWRRLTETEALQYAAGYSQIIRSGRSDISALPRLTLGLENRLKLIGCIGFKSQLREDAFKLVENLKKAEFKISMISGDNYENTLHVAKELKLGQNTGGLEAFRLHFDSTDRGHFELVNQLESVYHFIKQKNNKAFDHYLQYLLSSKSKSSEKNSHLEEVEGHLFAGEDFDFAKVFQRPMIISGTSLKIIQEAPRLMVLFRALSVFAHCFIGYNFEPMQKADIVNLLKGFGQKVLTIGDGVNDLSMFRASDISIQLETDHVPFYFGDIVVNRLDIIQKLVFIDGFGLYKSVRLSLMFAVVTISKFIIANIWIYTRSGFSTRYLSPTYTTVLLAMIVGDSIFRGVSQGTYSDFLLSTNPFIYQERIALDSQLLVFVACFVLNIFVEIGVLFFMLSLASKFLFVSGRFVEHEIQIAFVFFMLFLNMAYFSYSLYRHRPAKFSLSMLVIHHVMLVAILLYHQYQKVAPLASTFDLKEVFGDLSFLTVLLIVILVPTYFNFMMSYIILHKLIHPFRFYLMYTLGKLKDWQSKIEPAELKFLKLAMGRIRRNADRSVINLIAQLSKVCTELSKESIIDPILSKMMLIDMHTFTSGINQQTNQILDNRMSAKFMKISTKSYAGFTLFMFLFTALVLVITTAFVIYQSTNLLEIFRFHDFWKIVVLVIVSGYFKWCKPPPTADVLNPTSLALAVVVLIDLVFIPIDWVSKTSHVQYWTPNFFDSRLISSPVPLDFYVTCALVGVLDVTKIIRMLYMRGPVDESVDYWVYSLILVLHMLGFLLIQWSMKKKVGYF